MSERSGITSSSEVKRLVLEPEAVEGLDGPPTTNGGRDAFGGRSALGKTCGTRCVWEVEEHMAMRRCACTSGLGESQ